MNNICIQSDSENCSFTLKPSFFNQNNHMKSNQSKVVSKNNDRDFNLSTNKKVKKSKIKQSLDLKAT